FTWNTDVAAGEYTIKAYAYLVDSVTLESKPDLETNMEDNTFIDGTVTVTVPVENHDVAVLSVVPSPTTVTVGDDVNIDVEVTNQGDFDEAFTVEVYANADLIDQTDVSLASGETTTVSFIWTTTVAGEFTISAEVPPVEGEVDVADNTLTDGQVTIVPPIGDITPPTITIIEPTTRDYLHSENLTISFTVEDLESGVASVTATLDGDPVADGDNIPLYNLTLGEHTFEVTAMDNAGNTATETVTFNIIATVGSLQDLVDFFFETGQIDPPQSKRHRGITNSLLAKLKAAENYIEDGEIDDAIGVLGAFINQLQAQSGKHVSEFAADILITDAQYVIDNL
ncbi:hypothetical protein KAU30_02460, partial [Candidatus Bathyarchaeota archaeon]|nr:hypothetical protein [Candidatus Bathyarchaeota archaeon]